MESARKQGGRAGSFADPDDPFTALTRDGKQDLSGWSHDIGRVLKQDDTHFVARKNMVLATIYLEQLHTVAQTPRAPDLPLLRTALEAVAEGHDDSSGSRIINTAALANKFMLYKSWEEGYEEIEHEAEFETRIRRLQELAMKGDGVAQFDLGLLYLHMGSFHSQRLLDAGVHLLEYASKAKRIDDKTASLCALFTLSGLYLSRVGPVPHDFAKGMAYLELCIEMGHPPAKWTMGYVTQTPT